MIQLIEESYKYAEELIEKKEINFLSAWEFTADDGNKLLGDNEDWEAYSLFHLAKDTEEKEETKAYYKYPYGKQGLVYASALRAIRSRAAQQEHTEVFEAAGKLLELVKEKEERSSMKAIEYRKSQDIRAIGDKDEWIFEGYAVTWNSIDDYNSTFKKGSFKKTLTERGDKIKVLWNHNTDEPIGRVIEIREDKTGLFVKCLLTEGVSRAHDVYKNLKAGVINTLSFGFTPIQKSHRKDGVLEIKEVKLYEVSPVTFESNETAIITDVRESVDDKETRSEDFNETLDINVLQQKGYEILNALEETLRDVWFYNNNKEDIISKQDAAILAFHKEYIFWVSQYLDNFYEERKTALSTNNLSSAVIAEIRDIQEIASKTSFTTDELKTLASGKILSIESRKKLVELPESIRSAHKKERCKVVETLCNELREGGFSNAEKKRFSSLLGIEDTAEESDAVLNLIREIRKNVKE